MRLTVILLGHTLDLSLEPTAADEDDPAAALNGGTLASAGPVGFTPSPATPAEWQPPERTIPWDEPLEQAPEIPTRRYRGKG